MPPRQTAGRRPAYAEVLALGDGNRVARRVAAGLAPFAVGTGLLLWLGSMPAPGPVVPGAAQPVFVYPMPPGGPPGAPAGRGAPGARHRSRRAALPEVGFSQANAEGAPMERPLAGLAPEEDGAGEGGGRGGSGGGAGTGHGRGASPEDLAWTCEWPSVAGPLREGWVHFRVRVSSEGRPKSVEVLDATHPAMASKATECAFRQRYLPARGPDGVQAEGYTGRLTMHFTR